MTKPIEMWAVVDATGRIRLTTETEPILDGGGGLRVVRLVEQRDEPLAKLIAAMQRTQTTLRGFARRAQTPGEQAENSASADVLGDFIRLAAELQAGDGERAKVQP